MKTASAYISKKMERVYVTFFELRCFMLDQRCMSALLLASFRASRVTTDVCLAYVLTNIYPVAVIVVVVVSVC